MSFLAQFQPYEVAESGSSAARFTGYYEDSVVKFDGEWLFRERFIRL